MLSHPCPGANSSPHERWWMRPPVSRRAEPAFPVQERARALCHSLAGSRPAYANALRKLRQELKSRDVPEFRSVPASSVSERRVVMRRNSWKMEAATGFNFQVCQIRRELRCDIGEALVTKVTSGFTPDARSDHHRQDLHQRLAGGDACFAKHVRGRDPCAVKGLLAIRAGGAAHASFHVGEPRAAGARAGEGAT